MKTLSKILLTSLIVSYSFSMAWGQEERKTGLLTLKDGVAPGYILFAPKHATMTYLMDTDGQVVHEWTSCTYEPGQSVYLMPNGNLLRMCFSRNKVFGGGGDGGRFEEYDWDDNLVWEMDMNYGEQNAPDDAYMCHHDCAILPDGNILAIVWEYKNKEACLEAGRDPGKMKEEYLWPDYIAEIEKTGSKGGNIVWEWHVWDHLIQDFDPEKSNYGVVADHPELIDVNFWAETGKPYHANWNHMNSIAYNSDLDQIMLSVRGFSEIWIIDHSTTTEEASGHTGGRSGKGGDLLYRWGNPRAYGAGTGEDQVLFQGHDCLWIPDEYPGGGNISMFNNGPELGYSTVVEWDIPEVDENGNYPYTVGEAFGPVDLAWEYHPEQAYQDWNFFSGEISGAHRLPNGNTLMCSGTKGFFSEVNQAKEVLWEYINPMEQEDALYWNEEPSLDNRGHGMNGVFKIHKYPPDYPAFDGKELIPQGVIEQGGPTNINSQEQEKTSWRVYPNPVEDAIYIESGLQTEGCAEIYDMCGKLMIRKLLESAENKIDMAHLQQGIYLVRLMQDRETESHIIIKK